MQMGGVIELRKMLGDMLLGDMLRRGDISFLYEAKKRRGGKGAGHNECKRRSSAAFLYQGDFLRSPCRQGKT